MKNHVWLAIIAFICLPALGWAQKKDRKAEIKRIVEAQNYVFKAQTALPTAGATRQLTSDYDFRVSKDTIVSDLPYFGRAYTAPLNPSEGPLQFTSTDFQYTVNTNKKGGWNVSIAPKDRTDPRELLMTIFENGSASMVVNSNNRQPISFNGYVTTKR
ncbi:hypothetical protein A4H97_16625 [Niastella yeongjuensis]|uniref:DUF4251 domain-containing protein n=1 Tax=Niastella yeongjuensis TaxID=354355 RepID=A0A1V9E1R9_9BACT|nr:DUF4251 domain-containing protein [Niastella yeongjuensis]OQP39845.1 hypothetical protein A4H97_16625 [Niastella yeongjuensis]SEO07486.1 protein of unknown function [Niastella yeongjuensis]